MGRVSDLRLDRAGPIFFREAEQPARTFFVIFTNRSEDFLESSARDPDFFCDLHQPVRRFFGILNPGP